GVRLPVGIRRRGLPRLAHGAQSKERGGLAERFLQPMVRLLVANPELLPVIRMPRERMAKLVRKLKRKLRPEVAFRRQPDRHPSIGAMVVIGDRKIVRMVDEESRLVPARVRAMLPKRVTRRSQHRANVRLACGEVFTDPEVELAAGGQRLLRL